MSLLMVVLPSLSRFFDRLIRCDVPEGLDQQQHCCQEAPVSHWLKSLERLNLLYGRTLLSEQAYETCCPSSWVRAVIWSEIRPVLTEGTSIVITTPGRVPHSVLLLPWRLTWRRRSLQPRYPVGLIISPIFGIVRAAVVGRDSAVGIATRYGLYGPGIEFQWGRDFPHSSRPALGPTQPPVQWVPGLSRG